MLNVHLITHEPAGVSLARLTLDVSEQAFLEDHRVGPRAILSTVMSLEVMGEAAVLMAPGTVVSSITDLTKRRPLFVNDGVAATVEVEVRFESAEVLRCRIVSIADGARVAHDEALLTMAGRLEVGESTPAVGADPPWPSAAQSVVYELFFHGPSFQVVGSAQLIPDGLVATLNPSLPPLTRSPLGSAVAPRLIELCLQGAGLLELEATGRMMIPRSLDEVVRHSDVDVDFGQSLRAVVRRRPGREPTGESMVFDAVLVDEHDQTHLTVRGYRTAPFDQPVDAAAVSALVEALRG